MTHTPFQSLTRSVGVVLIAWVLLGPIALAQPDLNEQYPPLQPAPLIKPAPSPNLAPPVPQENAMEPLHPLNKAVPTYLTPEFLVSTTWWDAYGRDDLRAFVITALLNNLELRAKEFDLKAQQQALRKQFALELPTLSLGASWIKQKNSKNLISPRASQFSSGGANVFSPGSTFNIYNLPLTLNYEVDWLGKNHLQTQALRLRYEAEALKLRDMELALAEHAVNTAIQSIGTESRLELSRQRLTVLEEWEHLQRENYQAGLESKDNLLLRKQALETLKTSITALKNEAGVLEHEASYLAGQPVNAFVWKDPSLASTEYLRRVDLAPFLAWTSIESDRLLHRPDVGMSELQLQAAGVDVKVARRMFLPSFTLSAQAGLASTKLSNWFSWDSLLASVGASLAQQLFAGGAIKANLKQQKAIYESLGRLYQNQLLLAGRNAENALIDLKQRLEAATLAESQEQIAEEQYVLSQVRYKAGVTSYILTLSQQDALLQKRLATVTARQDALMAWNHLQRELGGGF
jgi:outer membrane protein, multidrug efflux system